MRLILLLGFQQCKAFDGRNVRCLWWPMFRQIRRTLRTFSIQYFRTDVCPKIANLEARKNDFERVTTFLPTNYNSLNDGKLFRADF